MNLNQVTLAGNCTRDPEIRATKSGSKVAAFGIATNRRWKDKVTGEAREETTFVEIEAWSGTAEIVEAQFHKGANVVIVGALQLDQWESKTGEKRSKLKVRAHSVALIAARPPQRPLGDGGGEPGATPREIDAETEL